MKLTIVNSTAPGTAGLLSPLFDALVDSGEVDLTVLEQAPLAESSRPFSCERTLSNSLYRYRLEPLPTYFYNRRHACAQVLSNQFKSLLAEIRPDVVYILGEPGYLSTYQVVRFAHRHLPRARICLLAAQNVYQRFPPPFPSIERWVMAHLDHAFPLGEEHEAVLRRKGYTGFATCVPLGVDTNAFAPRPRVALIQGIELPRPVVGYAGEFLPARDLSSLIEAVALCRLEPSLLLVGDGPSRPELESLAQQRSFADRILFAGRVPHCQMPHYLNSMDMLVLPSRAIRNRCFGIFQIANTEQFGRVLVEAMACGKPVVGSSCGEIPKVIGDAGRVYPEGRTDLLAATLQELCAHDALRARLGRAGLARARTVYDWRVIARQLLSVMRALPAPAEATRRSPTHLRRTALNADAVRALTSRRASSALPGSSARGD